MNKENGLDFSDRRKNVQQFFANLRRMQKEANMDPDDAMGLACEAQQWARNQRE